MSNEVKLLALDVQVSHRDPGVMGGSGKYEDASSQEAVLTTITWLT
jgi:hypothetical protein